MTKQREPQDTWRLNKLNSDIRILDVWEARSVVVEGWLENIYLGKTIILNDILKKWKDGNDIYFNPNKYDRRLKNN